MTKSSSSARQPGSRSTSTSRRKPKARRAESEDEVAAPITKPGKLAKAVRVLMGEDKPHKH